MSEPPASSSSSSSPPPDDARRARTPRRRRRAGAHLWDYVAVVRSHGLLSLLVAGGILAWVVVGALLATPVYEASARLEIEMDPSRRNDLLSDLLWYGNATYVGTEMEVLRSYSVAKGAAADPAARATALLVEKDAYRPLDVYLRQLRGEAWEPCLLQADPDEPTTTRHALTWRLEFDASGTGLEVFDAAEGGRQEVVDGIWLGEAFDDVNFDGRRNDEEPFTDLDGDGRFDPREPWTDTDVDGRRDPTEPFADLNGDGVHDPVGESFADVNENGTRDLAEPFEDRNGNGVYDPGRPFTVFGRTLRLTLEEGDPAGRTFLLTLRSPESAARWIHAGTSVEQVGDWTGIVDLRFSASTPQVATRMTNAVARSYIGLKERRKRERLDRTLTWLSKELLKVEKDLRAAHTERDDYISNAGAAHLSERAQGIYDKQGELIKQRFELEQRRKQLDAQLAALTGDRPTDELLVAIGSANVDTRTAELVTQRTNLEIERAVLLKGDATVRSPKVVEIDQTLQVVQQKLDEAVGALVAERRIDLGRRLDGVRASLGQVDAEDGRQQALLDELPETERRLIELARPIQTNEEFYASLKKSQKEAQMSRAAAMAGARLIDPAFEPTARKSPFLAKILIVAILLSVFGGIGIAFLLEYLNRTVKSPQELEDGLSLSIAGTIPHFRTVGRRDRRSYRGPLVALHAPSSVLAEAYRTLRANIRFSNPDTPVKSLAITSSVQQEGKTVTTLNLAIVMAKAGSRVVVVDADMRRPTTHELLGGRREPGVVNVLRDGSSWKDVVRKTEVENLDLIPAGRTPENPGALLDSEAFTKLLAELKDAYEYVLFDVPPVLAVADAASFFRQLDAILLLVRARRYSIEVPQGAQDQIERLHGNVLGAVFNAFDARRSARRGYGYYGYYGYYARYAEKAR